MSLSGIAKPWNLRAESLARLTTPVTLVLVVLIAYELARLSWHVLLPVSVPGPSMPPDASTSAPSSATVERDYKVIADWHLFGETKTQTAAPQPVIQAPETRLNLKLVGVFYSPDDGKARAIIGEGSNREESYSLGDSLSGGVNIVQIHRDKVILSRNGQLESLSLPFDSGSQDSLQATSVPAVVNTIAQARDMDVAALATQLRSSVLDRPDALEDLAFTRPYIENGQFIGFQLRPGRKPQLLTQLGLRNGDILVELNGNRLDSPAQGLMLLQELMTASTISATVVRNGNEIPFTFQLQ